MATVYVVQQPKPGPSGFVYDISPALRLGTPVFVFDATEQPGLTPGPSMRKAKKILKDFNDEDFILWAGGDPAALTLVSLAAADANQGRVTFLRWERERVDGVRTKRGYYIPVKISQRG